jgi:hypothetical protein
MPDWISVSEAAWLTGYSVYHLRDLLKLGTVKARKVVTIWQIDRASLSAYLRKQEKRGAKRGRKKRD